MEVLIAIALLVLLGGAMFGFLANLAQRRADLADLGRQAQATEALLSALERDLMTAIAGDSGAGAGIVGRRNNVRILSRGVVLDLSNPSLGDLQQTTYRFRPEDGAVECRKRDVHADPPPSTEEELGRSSPEPTRSRSRLSEPEQILTGVEKLEFRYYVRGNWRYSFNSGSAGRLPAAIEISIWYERPAGEDDDELALDEEMPLDAEQLAYERELFGEEAESTRLSFDVADLADGELPPDRRRVIVIPQIGLVEAASAAEEADPEVDASAPAGRPVEGSTEGGR
jgi:type II secretory pathway component PulJ